jgi:hypothetical protein
MAIATSKPRKEHVTAPAPAWSDPIVRRLRTNGKVDAAYDLFSRRLVPMLFALFVAAPIALLISPLFLPKFFRNWKRRRKYGVVQHNDELERIPGTHSRGKGSDRG